MLKINSLLIAVLICFASLTTFGQTDDQTKAELEKLTKEKTEIDQQIKDLNSKRTEIVNKINALSNKTGGSSTGATNSSGVLTTTDKSGGTLRDTPSSTGNSIYEISPNEEVLVLKKLVGLYLQVTYKGKTGWMNYNSIVTNAEIDKILSQSDKPAQGADKDKKTRLTKLYGEEKATKIISGILFIGESQGQVIESLGRPKNTTKTSSPEQGVVETWIYSDKELTFINGDLKKWE